MAYVVPLCTLRKIDKSIEKTISILLCTPRKIDKLIGKVSNGVIKGIWFFHSYFCYRPVALLFPKNPQIIKQRIVGLWSTSVASITTLTPVFNASGFPAHAPTSRSVSPDIMASINNCRSVNVTAVSPKNCHKRNRRKRSRKRKHFK